jgi:hypothetical protein
VALGDCPFWSFSVLVRRRSFGTGRDDRSLSTSAQPQTLLILPNNERILTRYGAGYDPTPSTFVIRQIALRCLDDCDSDYNMFRLAFAGRRAVASLPFPLHTRPSLKNITTGKVLCPSAAWSGHRVPGTRYPQSFYSTGAYNDPERFHKWYRIC